MLIIKSKYKLAKRLGAGVFEQTQTQKFALSEARVRTRTQPRGRRGGSDYGRQLLEKQRIRYTYGLTERQLSAYAKKAARAEKPAEALHALLEMRADNVVYRAGLAPTRRAARQIVSHGHVVVNGRRSTTPSYALRKGDVLAIREGKSRGSTLFSGLADRPEEERRSAPAWLSVDLNLLRVEVAGVPVYDPIGHGLDYTTLFEFYSR